MWPVPAPDPHAPPGGPPEGDDWTGLREDALPASEVAQWLVRPQCGASVVFSGTSRDHSEGREEVQLLTYEAYDSVALERIAAVVEECRARWPEVVRVAILHRVGDVPLSEAAVVVGASSGHRDVAFEAARFCIDAVKASVPVWKREIWQGGQDWGLDGAELIDPAEVTSSPFEGRDR